MIAGVVAALLSAALWGACAGLLLHLALGWWRVRRLLFVLRMRHDRVSLTTHRPSGGGAWSGFRLPSTVAQVSCCGRSAVSARNVNRGVSCYWCSSCGRLLYWGEVAA